MYRIFGIVNLHYDFEFGSLTSNRPLASLAFLGRYAFIDFPLSNFANSSIEEIGVLIKSKPRSLLKHFGFEYNEWLKNTKTGKMMLMYNEKGTLNPRENHAVSNLLENLWALKESKAEYVVLAPVHIVARFNYQHLAEFQASNDADITVVYNRNKNKPKHATYYRFDKKGQLLDLSQKSYQTGLNSVGLDILMIKRELLLEVLEKYRGQKKLPSLFTFVKQLKSKYRILGYEHQGYVRYYETIEDYFKYSMELLDPKIRGELFINSWPVYTRTYNTPPTYYGKNAVVKRSFAANGSVIKGKIYNSIIGRDVVIQEGAVIRNSILFSRTKVAAGAQLNYVITDKEAEITANKKIKGSIKKPYIVKQEETL